MINWTGIKPLKTSQFTITVIHCKSKFKFELLNLRWFTLVCVFCTLEPNSCVVIDDQFDEAIKETCIRQAFKVDRRHSEFSIILITQSIFDNGKLSKGIRNNCEVWVLFKNFGCVFQPLIKRFIKH